MTLLSQAAVPARFRDCRLSTFDPVRAKAGGAAALAWATERAETPFSGLISGTVGTGKTHLVVGILAARAEAYLAGYEVEREAVVASRRSKWTALFADVPTLLDDLRSWISHPTDEDPLWRYVRADLLILDDLGRERVTDWATERLYVLVNARYGEMRPTIATTNLRPSELVALAQYGPIVSRLLDGRPAVRIEGRDQRVGPPEGTPK
jgi:DNA replication protein DnaC